MSTALPPALVAYCAATGIDPALYDDAGDGGELRFVRVNSLRCKQSATSVALELDAAAELVAWLPGGGVLALPASVRLHASPNAAAGVVYGVDAASVAAVAALDPRPGERVLDLCAAPGAKTSLIAEAMGTHGHLVAVDASRPRLSACCTVMRRHGVVAVGSPQPGWRCQLVLADGTTFGGGAAVAALRSGALVPTGAALRGPGWATDGGRVEVLLDSAVENAFRRPPADGTVQRGAPPPFDPAAAGAAAAAQAAARVASAALRAVPPLAVGAGCEERASPPQPQPLLPNRDRDVGDAAAVVGDADSAATRHVNDAVTGEGSPGFEEAALDDGECGVFDRVLVDAECTHDGSPRHVAKFGSTWGWDALASRVAVEPHSLALLGAKQRALLANGFRLLRPGGVLVYSTCSMTTSQNEDVVAALLAANPDATLDPITHLRCGDNVAPAGGDSIVAGGGVDAAAADDDDAKAAPPHRRQSPPWDVGGLPGTRRFNPSHSGTSGLFIARILRVCRG